MNLHQLRMLCEVFDQGLNISKAATAMRTSQPSVSRQIRSLEEELGTQIFVRPEKRIVGITQSGAEILRVARRILREVDGLHRISADFGNEAAGDFTIATSHTHARYTLPGAIRRFSALYPNVHLTLRQGDPAHMSRLVGSGVADLLISASPIEDIPEVAFIPCRSLNRIVLTPKKHPLLRAGHLTLERLAKYPLITYDATFAFHSHVMQAFARKGIVPRVVLSATDIDVMKTYVRNGFGLALVTSLAYDVADREALTPIDATRLFGSSVLTVGLRKSHYVRSYVYEFIKLFAPDLQREKIDFAVFGGE